MLPSRTSSATYPPFTLVYTLRAVGYQLLVAFAVGAHYAFLAFGVFGGFLAWRWPRLIWVQVIAALWLLVIVVTEAEMPAHLARGPCPGRPRQTRAGEGGFLDNHAAGVIYPQGYEWVAQIVVAVLILTLVDRLRPYFSAAAASASSHAGGRCRRSSPGRAAPAVTPCSKSAPDLADDPHDAVVAGVDVRLGPEPVVVPGVAERVQPGTSSVLKSVWVRMRTWKYLAGPCPPGRSRCGSSASRRRCHRRRR